MRTLGILVAFMSATALTFAVGCSDDDGGNDDQEICNNGIDDDGDGMTDCADADCLNAQNCQVACDNDGICDAGEDSTNCPNDCAGTEICDNQLDDDGDGQVDCNDSDCDSDPACSTVCNNDGTCDSAQGENETNCPNDCGTTPTAELSCMALNSCYNCCGQDQTCAGECDAVASSDAAGEMSALMSCVQSSCSTECGSGGDQAACTTCIDTNCSTESDACDWGPAGTGGCIALNNCLNACDQPLESGTGTTCPDIEGANAGVGCYQDCFQAASESSADALFALIDCIFEVACETECGPNGNQTDCDNCQQAAMGAGGACETEAGACQ